MSDLRYLDTQQGRRIAYRKTEGKGPGVVFLGGLKSDMDGTKAIHLEAWAKARGGAFLRFDYSGHGSSSGAFTDGCIGDWANDAQAVIAAVTEGPQVLVGSSMGGWVSCLVMRSGAIPVVGFIGIAAAPDFTEDSMWAGFSGAQKAEMAATGQVALPSDYSDEPYVITRRMIEDGRNQLVLRARLAAPGPVRLLQGSADTDVLPEVAQRLFDHIDGPDVRLVMVKGADHRFSDPDCLSLITTSVSDVLAAAV